MKTPRLFIGTPVTVMINRCNKEPIVYNGTISGVGNGNTFSDYLVDPADDTEDEDPEIFCFEHEVKIRYDNPVPFTIWLMTPQQEAAVWNAVTLCILEHQVP